MNKAQFMKRWWEENNGPLPAGFRACEYLESTGEQWIDTGVDISNNIFIQAVIKFNALLNPSPGVETQINGAYSTLQSARNMRNDFAGITRDGTKFFLGCSTNSITTNVVADLQKHTFRINSETGKWSIDNINGSVEPNKEKILINTPILLFGRGVSRGAEKYYCKENAYSLIMRSGGLEVLNFLPALCLAGTTYTDGNSGEQVTAASNKPGMYDTVSGRFFTNRGTGADFLYQLAQP